MAVLQFPGPDGARPGTLAERAGMSKQAMNRLLGSLEELGYLVRNDAPDEGRARVVRFTKRGQAVYAWAEGFRSAQSVTLPRLGEPIDRLAVPAFARTT